MAQTERPQTVGGAQRQYISVNRNLPEDLLQRFISRNNFNPKLCEETGEEEEEEEEEEGQVELSLGLSLNGKFGVDPRAKMLSRSSSIPDFIKPEREKGSAFSAPVVGDNLVRTCSLPTETEEWRKRKEMQTLRRMEAKRKRSRKQCYSKAVKCRKRGLEEGGFEEDRRENGVVDHQNYHKEQLVKNPNSSSAVGLDSFVPPALVPAPLSQVSIGSQGSGSSGISESESQQVRGMNQCTEARSPAGVQSLLEYEQKLMVLPGSAAGEKSASAVGYSLEGKSHQLTGAETKAKEMARSAFEDMPCVSTRGDGPNGKRIEGFLYRYGKGEEVMIVCVCHGSIFSPAEFVKHGGGAGAEHPLKHIVVNPSPLLQ